MSVIDFSRTLDRALVHRRAIAEVLPTSTTLADDGSILIGVQMPRNHSFFGDILRSHGGHDPMLFLESVRQCMYVAAHLHCGAPLDRSFILRGIGIKVTEPSLLDFTSAPVDAVVRMRINRRFGHNNDTTTGYSQVCELLIDGRVVGQAEGSASWLTLPSMARLRARCRESRELPLVPVPMAPPARIAPAEVNRRAPLNVVISDLESGSDGDRAVIVVDTSNPTLFDHPLDHVPGMLMIEACRQTAIAGAARRGLTGRSWRLDAVSARFHEFAEHDQHAACHVAPTKATQQLDGSTELVCTATARQAGRRLLDVDLTLTSAVPVRKDDRNRSTPLVALP